MNLARPLACAFAILATSLSAQSAFRPGDVYLYNQTLTAFGSNGAGLMRIDPVSGATQVIVNYVTQQSVDQSATYDFYRDRIIAWGPLVSSTPALYSVTATGVPTALPVPADSYALLSPRGDGVIYLRTGLNPSVISFLDANNSLHTLMDSTGTMPYAFPGGAQTISTMIYHRGQNALYIGVPNGLNPCSGGSILDLNIYRVPLSPVGGRVSGTVTCNQVVIDPTGQNAPKSWSIMPTGMLMLVADTNSNAQQPRMNMIDPVTLASTVYASSGPYTGAAVTGTGIYSTARNQVVVLDQLGALLRSYPLGGMGGGSIAATGVSVGGSGGGIAQLFEIEPVGVSNSFRSNVSSISLATGGTATLTLEPGNGYPSELLVVAASQTGWRPGIPLNGFVVPIVFDALTNYSLTYVNTPPFNNNLSFLTASGIGTSTFVVPAGAPPGFAGTTVYFAALALQNGSLLNLVSNPVAVSLVP